MNSKEKAAEIVRRLRDMYPDAQCALLYEGEHWRLLVMAILSAQCTDARVNLVCRDLFARFPTVETMAQGDIGEIERLVRSCGLYRTKAANIKACCGIIAEKYGGRVPDTMRELLALPGVGRKIANLILGDIYRKPAVVTDTHCIRISGRLGFTPEGEKRPLVVEKTLSAVVEPAEQSDFCHRLVFFGRDVCRARKPECEICILRDLCEYSKKNRI